MILYVESNFVLELALLQAEHASCTAILDAAASGELLLVLPAFCVSEPYDVLIRRRKQRLELHRQLQDGMRELARSAPYQGAVEAIQGFMDIFRSSVEEEQRRLGEAFSNLLSLAQIIPVGAETISRGVELQEGLGFSPQDAIIYASILQHLEAAPAVPKCFVTKNTRDFDQPDVRSDMATYDCRLLASFRDGLSYLRSHSTAS